ncbi:MAG: ester cyclase [Acidimicrobiia bacterium]
MSAGNKAIARGWFDQVMNGRDVSAIDQLYSDDYSYWGPEGRTARGLEQTKAMAQMLIDSMPDRVSIVEDQIAEGDKVVTRWVSRGTPSMPLLGRPADGRRIAVHGITISRLSDGKIVEDWEILRMVEEADPA